MLLLFPVPVLVAPNVVLVLVASLRRIQRLLLHVLLEAVVLLRPTCTLQFARLIAIVVLNLHRRVFAAAVCFSGGSPSAPQLAHLAPLVLVV